MRKVTNFHVPTVPYPGNLPLPRLSYAYYTPESGHFPGYSMLKVTAKYSGNQQKYHSFVARSPADHIR